MLGTHYLPLDRVGNTARQRLPHEGHEWSLSAPLWCKGVAPVWHREAGDHLKPGSSSREYHATRAQCMLDRWPA